MPGTYGLRGAVAVVDRHLQKPGPQSGKSLVPSARLVSWSVQMFPGLTVQDSLERIALRLMELAPNDIPAAEASTEARTARRSTRALRIRSLPLPDQSFEFGEAPDSRCRSSASCLPPPAQWHCGEILADAHSRAGYCGHPPCDRDICSNTCSTLKLEGFCRGGNSLNVSTKSLTNACAGTTKKAR